MNLANNLGFTYTLSVNERATQDNLNKFIKQTLGGKDGLKIPVQLDIKSSFNTDQIKEVQDRLKRVYKDKLSLDIKLKLDTSSITATALRKAQTKLDEQAGKLFMNVDLDVKESTLANFSKSLGVFKELNEELEQTQSKLGKFNRSINVNFDNYGLKDGVADIREATAKFHATTVDTTAELEKQLTLHQKKLESLQNALNVKQKEIELAQEELKVAKQSQEARKKANETITNASDRINAIQTELDLNMKLMKQYEEQRKNLQHQANTQEKTADSIEESQKKIAELQQKQQTAKDAEKLARAELQRHQNSINMTKAEIKALEDKINTLKEVNNISEAGTTSTPSTKQSTSKKAEADITIKNLERVAETAIDTGNKVSKELNGIVESEAKVAEKALESEKQLVETKKESVKAQTKANQANEDSLEKANEILEAIDMSNFRLVASTKEASKQEDELVESLIKQRKVLRDIEYSKRDASEATAIEIQHMKRYNAQLEKELSLMLQIVGNNKGYNNNRSNVSKSLKKAGVADEEDIAKINEATRARLKGIQETNALEGVKYKYTKKLLSEIDKLQKTYGNDIGISNELLDAQNKKLEAHKKKQEEINEVKAVNRTKELIYPDAKSYVTERMFGFDPEDLDELIERYEAKITLKDGTVANTKTVDKMVDQIDRWKKKIEATNDETVIDQYQAKIDTMSKKMKTIKEIINTVEQLTAILDKNEKGDFYEFDYVNGKDSKTEQTTQAISENIRVMKQYCDMMDIYVRKQNILTTSTRDVARTMGQLRSDMDRNNNVNDAEKWSKITAEMMRLQQTIGITNGELDSFFGKQLNYEAIVEDLSQYNDVIKNSVELSEKLTKEPLTAVEDTAILEKQLKLKQQVLEKEVGILETAKEKTSASQQELQNLQETISKEEAHLARLKESNKTIKEMADIDFSDEQYQNSLKVVKALEEELVTQKEILKDAQARKTSEATNGKNMFEQVAHAKDLKKEYREIQQNIEDTQQEVDKLTGMLKAQSEIIEQPSKPVKVGSPTTPSNDLPASNVVLSENEQTMVNTMKDMAKYSTTYTESLSKQSALIVRMDSVYRDFMETLDKGKEPIPQLLFDNTEREKALSLQEQEDRLTLQQNNRLAKQTEMLRQQFDLQLRMVESKEDVKYIDEILTKEQRQLIDSMTTTVTTAEQLEEVTQQITHNFKEMRVSKSQNKTLEALAKDAEKQAEAVEKYNKQLQAQAEKERKVAQAVTEKIRTTTADLQQKYKQMSLTENINNLNDEQRRGWEALGQRLKTYGATEKEVVASQRELNREMKAFNIDGLTNKIAKQESMWYKLSKTLTSIPAQYIGLNEAIQVVERGMRGAYDRVMDLDSAYTNISMTMDVTKEKFATMQKTSIEAGKAQGILSSEVLEMMKVYANAGTTIEEINSQMAGTMAFKNVTGLDASTTTNSIQTILQQYKLLTDGAMSSAEAISYAGDVMTAVAYNLAKEESLAMQEVVSAVETAGNVIYQAGGSLEWYASITGTLTELMNASGSEIGNAMNNCGCL